MVAFIDAVWTPEPRNHSSRQFKLQRAGPDLKLASLGNGAHPSGAAGPWSLRKPDNVVWPGLKPRTLGIISERWSEPRGPNPPALRDPTLAERRRSGSVPSSEQTR